MFVLGQNEAISVVNPNPEKIGWIDRRDYEMKV